MSIDTENKGGKTKSWFCVGWLTLHLKANSDEHESLNMNEAATFG